MPSFTPRGRRHDRCRGGPETAKHRGRADVRSVSAKWAWVEYVLAQGGVAEALALYRAVKAGGRFAAYRKEFLALGHSPDGRGYAEVEAPIAPERAKNRHLLIARPS